MEDTVDAQDGIDKDSDVDMEWDHEDGEEEPKEDEME
jgi:hypothetical protein